MVTKNVGLQPLLENGSVKGLDDCDEETLSFCDLPLNSNSDSEWDRDISKEDQRSSDGDEDFFEFFNGEFSISTTYDNPPQNIIFCGKLIPYQGTMEADRHQKAQTKKVEVKNQSKSHSFNRSPRTSSSKHQQPIKSFETYYKTLSQDKNKYDLSMKNVSILAYPIQSRRCLYAFGLGRFPVEMEMSSVKRRQSKKSSQGATFKSDEGRSKPANNKHNNSGKRAKGLWGLVTVLGCMNLQASAMVKASFIQP